MKKLNIVFMGTPDFALPALVELSKVHNVVAVYTKEPKTQGRGMKLSKTPTHLFADQYKIPVFMPKNFQKAETVKQLKSLKADVAVVCAYGVILTEEILKAFPMGCINIHASLLPRWRGAAPIQRAIMAGDTETGITIMQLDTGLDTGDVLMKAVIPIGEKVNGAELHDMLADLGAEQIVHYFEKCGDIVPTPQSKLTGVTYAKKITHDDGLLDFTKSAKEVYDMIRAFNPYPTAFFNHRGMRIQVYESAIRQGIYGKKPGEVLDDELTVQCGDGAAVQLTELQRNGKKRVSVQDFLNGTPIARGEIIGKTP